jgi:cytosine/uracil/thiamine/allantoin permease
MKMLPVLRPLAGLVLALPATVSAADLPPTAATWHPQTLGQAVGYMLLFAAIGILVAIAGYKLFDKCTPGDLHKEIIENRNVAAAIVGGAVILGVCLIIAAAMVS